MLIRCAPISILFIGLVIPTAIAESVTFDLPPTAAGVMASSASDVVDAHEPVVGQSMEVALRLSAMISPDTPALDHLMIRVVPREGHWSVGDYAPRTETAPTLASTVEIQSIDESSHSAGLSGDLTYGHLAGAHAGLDRGGKQADTMKYQRHSPVHAVTASGTIQRGRGVYFKMNWTSQQILEGEKEVRITFDVPPGCRGGLLDVMVSAHRRDGDGDLAWTDIPVIGASIGNPKPTEPSGKMRRVAGQEFVVAVYRHGDAEAWQLARQLTRVEANLRTRAAEVTPRSSIRSLPGLIRHVAAKLDSDSPRDPTWVDRFVAGKADPYFDSTIKKLPTDVRVLALDYADLRTRLSRLTDQPSVTMSPLSWR